MTGLGAIAGRVYGPVPAEVSAAKVAEFVAATGDDPERWQDHAAPGYAATLLFAVAPAFFADPDVVPYTATLIHSDQRFRWHRAIAVGESVEVTGRVEGVRSRGDLGLVTFAVDSRTADGGAVVESTATFVMSAGGVTGGNGEEEAEPPNMERAANDLAAVTALPAQGGELPPLGKSASRADLVRYAGATRDFNPIHWDHATAVAAGLPGVIVHGLLIGAWASQAVTRAAPGVAAPLTDLRLRFRKPLRPAVAAEVRATVREVGEDTARITLAVHSEGVDLVTGEAGMRLAPVTR